MAAQLLLGKDVSTALMNDLGERVRSLGFAPQLHMIRLGDDPASVSYGRSKSRAAAKVGIDSTLHALPDDTSEEALSELIATLNADPEVDGVLVQLPLPAHIDSKAVLEQIDPDKDVDGFHPVNVGRLWSGQEALVPCTPAGLIRIMDHYGLPIEGRQLLVIGRSNIVGKPAAGLFLRRHATVTVAHSRTRGLAELCRQADIVVSAVGVAGLVRAEMVKPGATLLDVGISRVDGKIVGDMHQDVHEVAGQVTPMPGGTGRVTVAMLMLNTVQAALWRRGG